MVSFRSHEISCYWKDTAGKTDGKNGRKISQTLVSEKSRIKNFRSSLATE